MIERAARCSKAVLLLSLKGTGTWHEESGTSDVSAAEDLARMQGCH